jgi:hypothetical protein
MTEHKKLLSVLKREMSTKKNFIKGYRSIVDSMKKELKSLKKML